MPPESMVDSCKPIAYDEMPITSLLDICSFLEPSIIESTEDSHSRQIHALNTFAEIAPNLSPSRREVFSHGARLIMVETWGWNVGEARGAVQAVQKGFLSFSKTPTPKETIIETVDALLDADDIDDAVPWVLRGYLAEADLTILAGNPKAGKTTFASHIAQAVAKGRHFLDRATRQQTVLWIDLEQGRRKMRALSSRNWHWKGSSRRHRAIRISCRNGASTCGTRPSALQSPGRMSRWHLDPLWRLSTRASSACDLIA